MFREDGQAGQVAACPNPLEKAGGIVLPVKELYLFELEVAGYRNPRQASAPKSMECVRHSQRSCDRHLT